MKIAGAVLGGLNAVLWCKKTTAEETFAACETHESCENALWKIRLGMAVCCCYGDELTVLYERVGDRLNCQCTKPQNCDIKHGEQTGGGNSGFFRCSTTQQFIPLSEVNDGYCDCTDGSDEPSTAACAGVEGSQFFCLNEGHESIWIPSSRVHDGVCDCCDGSDESDTVCPNNCKILGQAVKEELERKEKIQREGWALRMKARETSNAKRDLVQSQVDSIASATDSLRVDLLAPLSDCISKEEKALHTLNRERLLGWARIQARRYRLGLSKQSEVEGKNDIENSESKSEQAHKEEVKEKSVDAVGDEELEDKIESEDNSEAEDESEAEDGGETEDDGELEDMNESDDDIYGGDDDFEESISDDELVEEEEEEEATEEKETWPRISSADIENIPSKLGEVGNIKMTLSEDGSFENPTLVVPLKRFAALKLQHIESKSKPIYKQSISERRKRTLLQPFLSQHSKHGWMGILKYVVEVLGLLFSPFRFLYDLVARAIPSTMANELVKVYLIPMKQMGVLVPLKRWFAQSGTEALWYSFWDAGPTMYFYFFGEPMETPSDLETPQLALMKETKIKLDRLIRDSESVLKDVRRRSSLDVGSYEEFFSMLDECFDIDSQGYRWTVCLFKDAKQGYTSLGTFQGWDEKKPSKTMLFTNGAQCWNGPKRSLNVTFECGLENRILSVDEPSVCSYLMEFGTPLVCEEPESEVNKQTK